MLHGVFRLCARKGLVQLGGCFYDCLIDPVKFEVYFCLCVCLLCAFLYYRLFTKMD